MLSLRNTDEAQSSLPMAIDIYINSTTIHDKDDACMNAIIDSFYQGDIYNTNHPGLYIQGQQAVFDLANLDLFDINFIGEADIIPVDTDKEFILTCCAVESILKKLYANDCVKKDAVNFQARRGNHFDGNLEISRITTIMLNPDKSEDDEIDMSFKKGLISHTYAYLEEKRICIFFNPMSQQQNNTIKSILNSLFKERNIAQQESMQISTSEKGKEQITYHG